MLQNIISCAHYYVDVRAIRIWGKRYILRMRWDSSLVMQPGVIGCFRSFNITHVCRQPYQLIRPRPVSQQHFQTDLSPSSIATLCPSLHLQSQTWWHFSLLLWWGPASWTLCRVSALQVIGSQPPEFTTSFPALPPALVHQLLVFGTPLA